MDVLQVKRKPTQLIAVVLDPGESITLTKNGATQTGDVLIVDQRPDDGDTAWVLKRNEFKAYYEELGEEI